MKIFLPALVGMVCFVSGAWAVQTDSDRYQLTSSGLIAAQESPQNTEQTIAPGIVPTTAFPSDSQKRRTIIREPEQESGKNQIWPSKPVPTAPPPVTFDQPTVLTLPAELAGNVEEIGNSFSETTLFHSGQTAAFGLKSKMPSVDKLIVPRATEQCADDELLATVQSRFGVGLDDEISDPSLVPDSRVPDGYQPWWSGQINRALGIKSASLPISLDSLIRSALEHSPHIQVAATEPHISQSAVFQEAARFDWGSFLESRYEDTNDPIGNTLTTGNNESRFRQKDWNLRSGLRRQNRYGGETELTQQLGYLSNNSRFLIPPNQGNSRLELNYRHPLMRGRGTMVNESIILLADIDFRTASDTFVENLQSHLVDVTSTYWELVRARSEYLQRRKLLASAESILANLEGRATVDALQRQIYRARAAVANRRAEIARSLTSIKNAESRLRLLVNGPELLEAAGMEFTPLDAPVSEFLPIELSDAISTAVINRPDISRAIREVAASNIQNGVAKNEMLPKLDLLLGSYVAGLDGDSDFLNSWVNQFRDGRPGFNVGFEFELPIGNRAATALQKRREWEVIRSLHKFRATMETGITEVEVAVREVRTAYQEMVGRYHAMIAANNEMAYLVDRWQTLPEADDAVTLLLENLLDSQERVADEEAAFAKAQFDFAIATIQLKKVTGTLFKLDQ